MRKVVVAILGVLLIGASMWVANAVIEGRKKFEPKSKSLEKSVYTQVVVNRTLPIEITTSGTLQSKYKVNLFAEVLGVLNFRKKEFRTGTYFKKREIILEINSQEFRANLLAQRSLFFKNLTAILADLKLDFPEEYPKWKNYVSKFKMNQPLQKLPKFDSEKERFFVASRNVLSGYYQLKNLEVRLTKYTIRAPFDGVISQTLVNQGGLVRAGTNLGTFVNPSVFRLEIKLDESYANMVNLGTEVKLSNLSKTISSKGVITHINPQVDQRSQTVAVFVEVRGNKTSLRDGMYLNAQVPLTPIKNVYEISKKLLVENRKVFIIQNQKLIYKEVTPMFFKKNSVLISGLDDQTEVLANSLPGAVEGMKVKVINPLTN